MKARKLANQKRPFFKARQGAIPTIGGNGAASKEVIMRAVNRSKGPQKGVVLIQKVPFRKRVAAVAKVGLATVLVSTALNLVTKSVSKAGVDRLARASDLKAKTTLVERNNSLRYTDRYPKVSPEVASREMKEVSRILMLNTKNEADSKIADAVFEVAQKAGVSPRIALRTLARSSGVARSLDKQAAMQRQRLQELEEAKEFEIADKASAELQRIEKIQAVLNARDSLNPEIKGQMMKRINAVD